MVVVVLRGIVVWCLTATLLVVHVLATVAKGEYINKNLTEADTTATTVTTDDTTHGGEVRCYCNLPRCVTQGYMCKSVLGACFTRNTPTPTHSYTHIHHNNKQYRHWAPMHGCLELLPEDRQKECASKAVLLPQKVTRASTSSQQPSQSDPDLTCCSHDMCNYRDFDVYIQVDRGAINSHTDMKKRRDSEMESLWFRAATIAVPIAGGFIFIVLVLVAAKMLAKENMRQRLAQQVLGERYLKAPLYPVRASAPPPLHHHHHHHPICYHPHPTKTPPIPHFNPKSGYQDNPTTHYRLPEHQDCTNSEELKPLNTVTITLPDEQQQCHQKESDSMLPT
ncbi:hypothetical protein Pmani_023576 [Petrolisthes manimaculis]|uniref:BMP and activin membrane-bound inhibitor homolog n=1 Tax=Petrolisthes manimaculis TaxID=1843537 RepID=A0AAE1P9C6_9EUCA|nr:hypothetical protein Pmani_023576 [Petrolisthes manimaculis]